MPKPVFPLSGCWTKIPQTTRLTPSWSVCKAIRSERQRRLPRGAEGRNLKLGRSIGTADKGRLCVEMMTSVLFAALGTSLGLRQTATRTEGFKALNRRRRSVSCTSACSRETPAGSPGPKRQAKAQTCQPNSIFGQDFCTGTAGKTHVFILLHPSKTQCVAIPR